MTNHRSPTIAKCFKVFLCLAQLVAVFALPASAQNGAGDLGVMTYNVNEGTDFQQVTGVTTTLQFLVGVGQIVSQVEGTRPPERMQAVATQILSAHPTLVSLQEADQWYQGSFDPLTGNCGAMSLQYDMVQELMDALAEQGGHYQVVMTAPSITLPPTPGLILPDTFLCEAVTDNNVILARTDLNPRIFHWSNPQSGRYIAATLFTTPAGTLPLTASWASIDVQFHESTFRFIGTHLDSTDAAVREAQGAELRAGPANTFLPLVVAMDSNAQAFPLPQDPTYADFIAAGYKDVWQEIFPSVPGLTCCQSEPDNNPVSQLYQRIDLILTFGKVVAQDIALFGANPNTRTPDGLWPSDHAGVAAHLNVQSN